MNACVVITGSSERITVSAGGKAGIAIRIEGSRYDERTLDLDSDLAREIGQTLVALADEQDEGDE